MDEDRIDAMLRLGEAHSLILENFVSRVKEGAKLIEIAEESERGIREMGYEPAFPTNISLNHIAAHYTPFPGDGSSIPSGSLVKLDMGSHDKGIIVDAARTVVLDDRYEDMAEVAREALLKAIEKMAPGRKLIEVSEAIYETIV